MIRETLFNQILHKCVLFKFDVGEKLFHGMDFISKGFSSLELILELLIINDSLIFM